MERSSFSWDDDMSEVLALARRGKWQEKNKV